MPRKINLYTLEELSNDSTKNEILIDTKKHLEIHIINSTKGTYIKFPFGNRFKVVEDIIYIENLNI